jgi:hypothetical protein
MNNGTARRRRRDTTQEHPSEITRDHFRGVPPGGS